MQVVNEQFTRQYADRTIVKSDFMAFLIKLRYPAGVEFLETVCHVNEIPEKVDLTLPKFTTRRLFGHERASSTGS